MDLPIFMMVSPAAKPLAYDFWLVALLYTTALADPRGPPFPPLATPPIFAAMAKPPDKPKKPRDYARPTRSKAHRPDSAPTDPALERLLNPGIARGTAGMGSGTGLQQPPDNSFERRADRRNEHTARKSVVKGFEEAPQRGYVARAPLDINAELANALGYGTRDPNKSLIDDS